MRLSYSKDGRPSYQKSFTSEVSHHGQDFPEIVSSNKTFKNNLALMQKKSNMTREFNTPSRRVNQHQNGLSRLKSVNHLQNIQQPNSISHELAALQTGPTIAIDQLLSPQSQQSLHVLGQHIPEGQYQGNRFTSPKPIKKLGPSRGGIHNAISQA